MNKIWGLIFILCLMKSLIYIILLSIWTISHGHAEINLFDDGSNPFLKDLGEEKPVRQKPAKDQDDSDLFSKMMDFEKKEKAKQLAIKRKKEQEEERQRQIAKAKKEAYEARIANAKYVHSDELLKAVDLYKKGRFKEAKQEFEKLSGLGDGTADFFLGYMNLFLIESKEVNFQTSLEKFERAKRLKSPLASYGLMIMADQGYGMTKDIKKAYGYADQALEYLLSDVNHYNLMSAYFLGIMFDFGYGTAKNPKEAKKWFEISLQNGCLLSLESLSYLCLDNNDGLRKDIPKAIAHANRLADNCDHGSVYMLHAWLKKLGHTTNQSGSILELLKKASDKGDYLAKVFLGNQALYKQPFFKYPKHEYGSYFIPDGNAKEAITYYQYPYHLIPNTCEYSYASALIKNGQTQEGIAIYESLVENKNHAFAAMELGGIYSQGLNDLSVSDDQAMKWYFIAAQLGNAGANEYANQLLEAKIEQQQAEAQQRENFTKGLVAIGFAAAVASSDLDAVSKVDIAAGFARDIFSDDARMTMFNQAIQNTHVRMKEERAFENKMVRLQNDAIRKIDAINRENQLKARRRYEEQKRLHEAKLARKREIHKQLYGSTRVKKATKKYEPYDPYKNKSEPSSHEQGSSNKSIAKADHSKNSKGGIFEKFNEVTGDEELNQETVEEKSKAEIEQDKVKNLYKKRNYDNYIHKYDYLIPGFYINFKNSKSQNQFVELNILNIGATQVNKGKYWVGHKNKRYRHGDPDDVKNLHRDEEPWEGHIFSPIIDYEGYFSGFYKKTHKYANQRTYYFAKDGSGLFFSKGWYVNMNTVKNFSYNNKKLIRELNDLCEEKQNYAHKELSMFYSKKKMRVIEDTTLPE